MLAPMGDTVPVQLSTEETIDVAIGEPPRLSKSIAMELLYECPYAAWYYHRLLGGHSKPQTEAMADGLIYEALITGQTDRIELVDADSFRTKEARELRDAALAAGKTPMVRAKFDAYSETATSLRETIARVAPGFLEGELQRRVEWESGGVPCSGVMDSVDVDGRMVWDLKMSNSLRTDALLRTVDRDGWDIQHAAYTVAAQHEWGEPFRMAFIVCQTAPFPAVRVVWLDYDLQHCGKLKWRAARRLWRECIETDTWPSYDAERCVLEAMPWHLSNAEAIHAGAMPKGGANDDEDA